MVFPWTETAPCKIEETEQNSRNILDLDDFQMKMGLFCSTNDSSKPHGTEMLNLLNSEGEWGAVCDDGWNIHSANVVCKQLGHPHALGQTNQAYFGKPTQGFARCSL